MLKRMLIGAAAGALATVPQSVVVWGLRWAGVYHTPPPPKEVSKEVTGTIINLQSVPKPLRKAVIYGEHFGFGASAGAAFGLATAVTKPTTLAGLLAGLGVWQASYAGWIPAFNILPPPGKGEGGRTVTMVLAHVAYGLALGMLVQRWTARGSSEHGSH